MQVSDAQLMGWMQSYLWVFTRLGAAFMVAPLLGAGRTPLRIRLTLTLALTALITPTLPAMETLPAWSAAWWAQAGQQIMIGVAIGLCLRLCFEAVMIAGSLIANSMGLGFAQLADPVNGSSTPVVGQFLNIFAVLLFLSLNGHLALIRLLTDSLHTLPPGGAGLGRAGAYELALAGLQMFSGAVQIALPATVALLLANLAFGVMSRAAPTLNLMSVGMPVSLLVGLLLLQATLPALQTAFSQLLLDSWTRIAGLTRV